MYLHKEFKPIAFAARICTCKYL